MDALFKKKQLEVEAISDKQDEQDLNSGMLLKKAL